MAAHNTAERISARSTDGRAWLHQGPLVALPNYEQMCCSLGELLWTRQESVSRRTGFEDGRADNSTCL